MRNNKYNDDFYKEREKQTVYSAKRIISIVLDSLGGEETVKSAIDVGCGVGTWLNQIHLLCQTDDVWGLDGEYVKRKYLMIPTNHFYTCDLEEKINKNRRYNLAISLEVAEHLSPERAEGFVRDLCQLSDNVLFSAATVFQGGIGHINEQRISYWAEKFSIFGYEPLDIVRPEIWDDTKIPVWYRQNIVLFRKTTKDKSQYDKVRDIIHPDLYEEKLTIMHHYNSKLLFKIYLGVKKFVINVGHKIKN